MQHESEAGTNEVNWMMEGVTKSQNVEKLARWLLLVIGDVMSPYLPKWTQDIGARQISCPPNLTTLKCQIDRI